VEKDTKKRPKNKAKTKEQVEKLNNYALSLQMNIDNDEAFEAIHAALHNFIISQAFHRFIIKGQEGKDLYQESLIVLWQKAIPKFNPDKGMSFLGFAKMCINRHLITILNSALNRKKDIPMNRSVSLDEVFGGKDGDEEGCSLYNMLADEDTDFVRDLCSNQDRHETVKKLKAELSPFESMVLYHYLDHLSYKEIAESVSNTLGTRYNEKSVDNALLRIRRKASDLMSEVQLALFE
jgi:RNA polymerase sporulation-specific sigma factor